MNATDIDSEAFSNVSYEVFPESMLFSVTTLESGEGEVRVEGLLDREALDRYTITILARDGGTYNTFTWEDYGLCLLIQKSMHIVLNCMGDLRRCCEWQWALGFTSILHSRSFPCNNCFCI